MGQPLVLPGRPENISRVKDHQAFTSNFDNITGRSGKVKSRHRVVYKNGVRIVEIEDGVRRCSVPLTPNHIFSGITVYDVVKHSQEMDKQRKVQVETPSAAEIAVGEKIYKERYAR